MKTMKKTAFTFLAVAFASSFAFSQTVDEGIKDIYYGKTKSAIQALEKVVAGKPKDAYSIYWLGQAYLRDYEAGNKDQLAKAAVTYQNALQAGVNDPWIWVGSGNVIIMQNGDINKAKQNFEQAITSTKGKKGAESADILNAVGRANAMGDSKQGDAQYGIDKLKRAAELDLKNPDIDINLGICYLKLGSDHGGEAVLAFNDAIARDPKYAAAYYRIGLIYQSQNNKEAMDEWYAKAIVADPAYAPVYYEYYRYYSEKDVNAAKEYIDKFVANSDQDCKTSYFQADYLFRAGKYQESMDRAKAMAAGDCKTFARLNLLFAYDYDRLGDSVQARSYLQKFFATATEFQPDDYEFAGMLYAKFPGDADTAAKYLEIAIDVDTIKADKIVYINTAVNIMQKAGELTQEENLMKIREKLRDQTKLPESDYYKLGTAAVAAIGTAPADSISIIKAYTLADSIAKAYIADYPDKPQGYTIRVNAAKKADRDTAWGLAIEPITTANAFFLKDTSAFAKNSVFVNDYYLVLYYLNHSKMARIDQYRKAITLLDEMASVTAPGSDGNTFATKTGDSLKAAVAKYEASRNKSGGGGSGGSPKPNK